MIEYEYLNTTFLGILFKFIVLMLGVVYVVTSTAYSIYFLRNSQNDEDKQKFYSISKTNLFMIIFLVIMVIILNNDLNNINVEKLEFTVEDIKKADSSKNLLSKNIENNGYEIKTVENIGTFDIYVSEKYLKYHDIKEGDKMYLERPEELELINGKTINLSRLYNMKKVGD